MGFTHSPLRFPGGKTRLANFIETTMRDNELMGGNYVEPYAGGAGVAWRLLIDDFVSDVYINDIDPALFAFWRSVFTATNDLCRLIRDTPVTMTSWHRQKAVLDQPAGHSRIELGFATFFLNRTNRSGILTGGVIGGKQQRGKYRLSARYNKGNLIKRIERLSSFRARVHLYNLDAAEFIAKVWPSVGSKSLTYLDPPYYEKGAGLYENHYSLEDHQDIARLVITEGKKKWIVSYDDQDAIKTLYEGYTQLAYPVSYSAQDKYAGRELMIFCHDLAVPSCETPLMVKRPKKLAVTSQLP